VPELYVLSYHNIISTSTHTPKHARTYNVNEYPPMSIDRHSFTQLSNMQQRRVNELPQDRHASKGL